MTHVLFTFTPFQYHLLFLHTIYYLIYLLSIYCSPFITVSSSLFPTHHWLFLFIHFRFPVPYMQCPCTVFYILFVLSASLIRVSWVLLLLSSFTFILLFMYLVLYLNNSCLYRDSCKTRVSRICLFNFLSTIYHYLFRNYYSVFPTYLEFTIQYSLFLKIHYSVCPIYFEFTI